MFILFIFYVGKFYRGEKKKETKSTANVALIQWIPDVGHGIF